MLNTNETSYQRQEDKLRHVEGDEQSVVRSVILEQTWYEKLFSMHT